MTSVSVRKTEAWTAYDGTMHATERGALLSSLGTVLGIAGDPFPLLKGATVEDIDKNLPALMPLFNRLLDPRNRPRDVKAEAPAEQIDTRTFEDAPHAVGFEPPADDEAFTGCECAALMNGDNNHISSCPMFRPETNAAPIDPIELHDLRPGQLVELADETGLLIVKIDPDAELPIMGKIEDGAGNVGDAEVALETIVRVLKQPEDMMDQDAAERALRALTEEELEAGNDSATRSSIHKRRILLLRRLEQLSKGEVE